MRLYDFPLAPSPRRVRMFLAEKGIELPTVEVDIRAAAQFDDGFRRRNPWSLVPVLELADGTCIAESGAICRYLEELHPDPPLIGRDARDRALVEMWDRRVELYGYVPLADAVRNRSPLFRDRAVPGQPSGHPQIEAVAERGLARYRLFLERLNERLEESEWIAGGHFTIADITAFVTVEFAGRVEEGIPADHEGIHRWHARVADRPSARA